MSMNVTGNVSHQTEYQQLRSYMDITHPDVFGDALLSLPQIPVTFLFCDLVLSPD